MPPLSLTSSALVICECQAGFIDPAFAYLGGLAEQAETRQIVPKIAELAVAVREAGRPVIHSTIVHRRSWAGVSNAARIVRVAKRSAVAMEDDPSSAIVPELSPADSDILSQRSSGNTIFYNTDLDSILRVAEVDTIILVGVSTNLALYSASVEATNRNYTVVLAEDCCAGATVETHAFMIEHLLPLVSTVTTSDAVVESLRAL